MTKKILFSLFPAIIDYETFAEQNMDPNFQL